MAEVLSKKLELVFKNEMGGQNILSPKLFREEVTGLVIQDWMERFSQLALFYNYEKGMALYTEKKNARIVETRVTDLFNELGE